MFDQRVAFELDTPGVGQLDDVVNALRDWQREDAPIQLHPGDLGWYWRFGASATAKALRTWNRNGEPLAIGFLDGPDVLRMTVAPQVWRENQLAAQVVADVADPGRGVLPAGRVSVEAPDGTRVQELLSEVGWSAGEAWTPLRHDLDLPVAETSLRVEVVQPGRESAFTAVHRSAWDSDQFTDQLWQTMAAGLPYADARCLLGYDGAGVPVAGVTVWGSGAGKPGLIEPLGVHADHRGRGYARAICVGAAATALKELGSSSALVCTPSARVSAVNTYKSAGFRPLPERLDRTRNG